MGTGEVEVERVGKGWGVRKNNLTGTMQVSPQDKSQFNDRTLYIKGMGHYTMYFDLMVNSV